ncbi:MAG: glycosyltransferase [Pseudomonadota bacterium]
MIPVSLVVVSHGRPDYLARLIGALRFQTCPKFELIIVSDAPTPLANPHKIRLKFVHFREANISAARNAGLAQAGGAVVAFCDDDAIPDPPWLERLAAAFNDERVGVAGGPVRGRNGISLQWRPCLVDAAGFDHPTVGGSTLLWARDGRYPRVHGTNCAFRTDALRKIGGFDPGFRFYLDETDVCVRLGAAGWATVAVEGAQVVHGFAPSARRRSDRAPRTLFDVGASTARFLEKHAPAQRDAAFARVRAERRAGLLRMMVSGRIEPREVRRLLGTLNQGLQSPPDSPETEATNRQESAQFLATDHRAPERSVMVAGHRKSAAKMVSLAKKLSNEPVSVIILNFSFTTLFHIFGYDDQGFWVQRGGVFGKSDRDAGALQRHTIASRAQAERERLKTTFPIHELILM